MGAAKTSHTPRAPSAKTTKSPGQNPASSGAPSPAKTTTPAMRQYLEQKAAVGDAILLFRMGDFYETFYDDARTIARVLGLTLTARDKNSENPVPLAGVPYHAVDRYVARLVQAGYKVAISEQLEDASQAKSVVKRDVVRIITPGTLTDEALMEETRANYLVAICPETKSWSAGRIGLACVELASGRFFAQMLPADSALDEIVRLRPAELLAPEIDIDASVPFLDRIREAIPIPVSSRPRHIFDSHLAERRMLDHFKISSFEGYGFERFDASLCAAAAILDYLLETQKTSLAHVLKIIPRDADENVVIDHFTLRSLEVERTFRDGEREGSLLAAIDMTAGPMGARRLRDWLCFPLRSTSQISRRQDAITALRSRPDLLTRVRSAIREMGDLERILARLGVERASPRDMVGLGRGLLLCAEIAGLLDGRSTSDDLLGELTRAAGGFEELGRYLTTSFKEGAPPVARDGGFIADGFHAELDRLRNVGRDGARSLAELQAREIERTGIPSLKIDYNSVFGYYIEITHQHREKVPPEYVRKQTVRNAERYITDELKRYEDDVLSAADRAKQLELQLFAEIRRRAAGQLAGMLTAADAMASLDVLGAFAELARQRDYCRPEFVGPAARVDSALLEIIEGRHPVLDVLLAERFVPNDVRLSPTGDRLLLITGPNMAGKSTYIRQIALLVLLAHTGSCVPAKSMRLAPVDRIFARVGASDELARGHSTFMVEMVETARILNSATRQSLIILDEIGRGTSTYDGLAIAWAVTEYLAKSVGCRALFATHYHELTRLAEQLSGVANFNVAVAEQLRPEGTGRDVVFLHRILPGVTDRSYGVHVAAMAGLPPSVVHRSEEILTKLESGQALDSTPATKGGRRAADSDQLSLFGPAPAAPSEWKQAVDRLASLMVDEMTPIDALNLLGELQKLVRRADSGT